MMDAPEGTFRWNEIISPPKQLMYPMPMESQMIRWKRCEKRLAVIWGMVSNEMTSTMPTMRRHVLG